MAEIGIMEWWKYGILGLIKCLSARGNDEKANRNIYQRLKIKQEIIFI
jgi:hypothetical protein